MLETRADQASAGSRPGQGWRLQTLGPLGIERRLKRGIGSRDELDHRGVAWRSLRSSGREPAPRGPWGRVGGSELQAPTQGPGGRGAQSTVALSRVRLGVACH